MDISSGDIKKCLAERHAGDIGTPEAMIGGSGAQRFDFWATKASWAHTESYGYEIKVNRSDFLQDSKWRDYLDFCNCFYFVCPFGLIDKSELPKEAGLMYCSRTGSILYTKKKAPQRKIPAENELLMFRSVLMWRCREKETKKDRMDFWREQLSGRRELNYKIKSHIEGLAKKKVAEIVKENAVFKEQHYQLIKIKEWADENNVDLSGWNVAEQLDSLKTNTFTPQVSRSIVNAAENLQEIIKALKLVE